jgi:hypothetical protein
MAGAGGEAPGQDVRTAKFGRFWYFEI